jgi:hypothetical protein
MTGNTRRAFIAASNLFTAATFPFGRGVVAETAGHAARRQSIRQPALRTSRQWYEISIPPEDCFFHLHLPLKDQPFPALHRLMSQESLAAIFYDDYAVFKWRLDSFRKSVPEAEQKAAADYETHSFFHQRRETVLALPSGDSFLSLLTANGTCADPARTASFFDHVGIAGIEFDDSGGTRFLIFNARKSITITSVRRERTAPGKENSNYERP